MSTPLIVIDGFGWLGAFLLTLAYALVWFRPELAGGNAYALINILGCSLLIGNTAWHRAWPSTLTNVFWGLIATGGLLRKFAIDKRSRTADAVRSSCGEDGAVR